MTLEVKEKFYQQDTVTMAKELLGKILILKNKNEIFAGYIVETEAYLGEFDKACHGYGNKKTPKVEALFEKAGTVYIYTMHTHKMLNIVSCEEGDPQAVLIRAVEPILNVNVMEENRGKSGILVSNGPGKLTKAFGIDDRFNKTEIQIIEKNMFEIEELVEKLKNKNFGIKYDISKINEKYFVRKNDVLFQAKGSKIEVVYVDKDYENVLPATLYFILRANEKINPKYLQWLLKTELLLLYFEKKYKTMSAVRAVNKTDIVELDIDLPEREVQDRMVEIINNFETEEESTMEYLQLKKKYIEEKILAENKVIINEE